MDFSGQLRCEHVYIADGGVLLNFRRIIIACVIALLLPVLSYADARYRSGAHVTAKSVKAHEAQGRSIKKRHRSKKRSRKHHRHVASIAVFSTIGHNPLTEQV